MKTSMKSKLAVVALVAALVYCNQAILTAPTGSTVTVVANPTFIAANGEVSVVSALVIEPAGTVVPDGMEVARFLIPLRLGTSGRMPL